MVQAASFAILLLQPLCELSILQRLVHLGLRKVQLGVAHSELAEAGRLRKGRLAFGHLDLELLTQLLHHCVVKHFPLIFLSQQNLLDFNLLFVHQVSRCAEKHFVSVDANFDQGFFEGRVGNAQVSRGLLIFSFHCGLHTHMLPLLHLPEDQLDVFGSAQDWNNLGLVGPEHKLLERHLGLLLRNVLVNCERLSTCQTVKFEHMFQEALVPLKESANLTRLQKQLQLHLEVCVLLLQYFLLLDLDFDFPSGCLLKFLLSLFCV